MKFTYYLSIAMLAMSVAFTSCKPEDGDPGPAGQNGTNGTNGENGVGFDKSVQYGNIYVKLEGKRPSDTQNFKDSINFQFSPEDYYYNTVNKTVDGAEYYTFDIMRLHGATNYHYENYVEIYFQQVKDGSDITINPYGFYLETAITTADHKIFFINDSYYPENGFFTQESISEYSYDSSTGALKFKFNFTVPAESNSTGSELKISGAVNITVFEALNSGGSVG